MIENILSDKVLMAMIIRANYKNKGITFFTPEEFSQQLAYMNRPKGYIIQPHIHKHLERKVMYTQEVLIIRSGVVRVDFYDGSQNYLESSTLLEGDVILLASGGHGFEILEDAEIIEVKQGPYCKENDKVTFKNVKKRVAIDQL